MELVELLKKGRAEGASDVHFLENEYPIYRINGAIYRDKTTKITKIEVKHFLEELLSKDKLELFDQEKEMDFAFFDTLKNRYRVNLHYQMGTVGISIRILKNEIPPLLELGLPSGIEKLLNNENGMILVSGATGSGKSTTLAAMIEELNMTKNLNIITMEDPVEYLFQSKKSMIRQREIGSDTKSFQRALKSALRQDPDVILIGEMRDLESIEMAITVAETGHLVLGTLHTIGAIESIDRITDVFPKEKQNQIRVQIANVLRGVINQRLIPGVDQRMVLACEILINTPAVASYILQGKTNQIASVLESSQKQGMISMRRSLEMLYKKGKISEKEFHGRT